MGSILSSISEPNRSIDLTEASSLRIAVSALPLRRARTHESASAL